MSKKNSRASWKLLLMHQKRHSVPCTARPDTHARTRAHAHTRTCAHTRTRDTPSSTPRNSQTKLTINISSTFWRRRKARIRSWRRRSTQERDHFESDHSDTKTLPVTIRADSIRWTLMDHCVCVWVGGCECVCVDGAVTGPFVDPCVCGWVWL